MKKYMLAAALCFSASAMANGPYDGLFQSNTDEKSFMMIQQNGNYMLATNYYSIPISGVVMNYGNIASVKPKELLVWDGYMGLMEGNRAVVTGLAINMACEMTLEIVIDGAALTIKVLKIEQTREGYLQDVPCARLRPVGGTVTAKRVF